MKTFAKIAAQGEITIRRLGGIPKDRKLPSGFSPMKPEGDQFIIGHSETGHHHIIPAAGAMVGVMDRPPEGMHVLYAILENPLFEHLRGYDTHETLTNEPGVYEIRIAREYNPYDDLARRSAD